MIESVEITPSQWRIDNDKYASLLLLYGADEHGFVALGNVDSETATWIISYQREISAINRRIATKMQKLVAQKMHELKGKEDKKEFREFIKQLMYL